MKLLRPVLLATLLVLTFYFVTTRLAGPDAPSWVTRPTHVELTQAAGPANFDADEQNNIAVYKKALPSVVNITSTAVAYDFFYGPVPQQGMGSGFVIDTEGHILTNNHVVEGARQLEVTTSDKKKYKAQIVVLIPSTIWRSSRFPTNLCPGRDWRLQEPGGGPESVCHRQPVWP